MVNMKNEKEKMSDPGIGSQSGGLADFIEEGPKGPGGPIGCHGVKMDPVPGVYGYAKMNNPDKYDGSMAANMYQTNGVNYMQTPYTGGVWDGSQQNPMYHYSTPESKPQAEPTKLESSVELEHVEVTKEFLIELIQIVTTQNVTLYMKGVTVKEDDEIFEKVKEEIEANIKSANEIVDDPLDNVIDTELGMDTGGITDQEELEDFKNVQDIITKETESNYKNYPDYPKPENKEVGSTISPLKQQAPKTNLL